MENPEFSLKIPNQLCQSIFNCQFQIDIGNITEQIISKAIQYYSEAINFYLSQKSQKPQIKKRAQFYQDKIKKLLIRKDVQKCLIGKKINPRSINIQHQIQKCRESAPEQAKALIAFYKTQHENQQNLIKKTMQEQNQKLTQRIAKRSRSKSNCLKSPAKTQLNNIRVALGISLKQF